MAAYPEQGQRCLAAQRTTRYSICRDGIISLKMNTFQHPQKRVMGLQLSSIVSGTARHLAEISWQNRWYNSFTGFAGRRFCTWETASYFHTESKQIHLADHAAVIPREGESNRVDRKPYLMYHKNRTRLYKRRYREATILLRFMQDGMRLNLNEY